MERRMQALQSRMGITNNVAIRQQILEVIKAVVQGYLNTLIPKIRYRISEIFDMKYAPTVTFIFDDNKYTQEDHDISLTSALNRHYAIVERERKLKEEAKNVREQLKRERELSKRGGSNMNIDGYDNYDGYDNDDMNISGPVNVSKLRREFDGIILDKYGRDEYGFEYRSGGAEDASEELKREIHLAVTDANKQIKLGKGVTDMKQIRDKGDEDEDDDDVNDDEYVDEEGEEEVERERLPEDDNSQGPAMNKRR